MNRVLQAAEPTHKISSLMKILIVGCPMAFFKYGAPKLIDEPFPVLDLWMHLIHGHDCLLSPC